jgi:hypothetical protein
MLDSIAIAKAEGLDGQEAQMAAFMANNRDLARVSGN